METPQDVNRPEATDPSVSAIPTAEERNARRALTIGLAVAGVVLLIVIALLIWLSVEAYQAAGPTAAPGAAVVSVLRDAAIIFVAFETILIGLFLIILTIQVRALVVLLRDEIKPMLESANETMATMRGTTQFVSHHVVTPVVEASSYLAGLQRIVSQIMGGGKRSSRKQSVRSAVEPDSSFEVVE